MDKCTEIFQKVFGLSETEMEGIQDKHLRDFDSMSFLLFISELETELGIRLAMNEVLSIETLSDVQKLVSQKQD